MITNLYFVRHAHSIYTPDELNRPLSERGFEDANTVTEYLQKEKIDVVISSPYKRAIQTVEGVAKRINKNVVVEEDFKERKLSETTVYDFDDAMSKVWENDHFSWEGGESNTIAQKRGVSATKRVLNKYVGQNIVIGTHGNIMVLIMKYYDAQYDFNFWKELAMPDVYKLTFEYENLVEVKRIWGM